MTEGKEKAEMLDEAQQIYVHDEQAMQELKKQWESDKAVGADTELQSRIAYAVALSRSPTRADKVQAIDMLTESVWQCGDPNYRAEVLMHLCIVNYALEDYDKARLWCSELLQMYPDHKQVKDLFSAILYKHRKQQECKHCNVVDMLSLLARECLC